MNQEVTRIIYGILCLMIISWPGLLLTNTLFGTTLPHSSQIERKREKKGKGKRKGQGWEQGRGGKGLRKGITERDYGILIILRDDFTKNCIHL